MHDTRNTMIAIMVVQGIWSRAELPNGPTRKYERQCLRILVHCIPLDRVFEGSAAGNDKNRELEFDAGRLVSLDFDAHIEYTTDVGRDKGTLAVQRQRKL